MLAQVMMLHKRYYDQSPPSIRDTRKSLTEAHIMAPFVIILKAHLCQG